MVAVGGPTATTRSGSTAAGRRRGPGRSDRRGRPADALERRERRPRPTPGAGRHRRRRRDARRQPGGRPQLLDALGAVTTTIRSTAGAAANASSVQASSGRPRSAPRACRCRPSARRAGRDDDRRRRAARPPAALNRAVAGRRSSGRRRSGGRGSRRRRAPGRCSRAPPSTTIIVPSSRKPTPCPGSLPSWMTRTRSSSPGRTAGFTAFASELMFRTRTPWSSATRFRLKSFVRIARLRARASATSLASTSGMSGHVARR